MFERYAVFYTPDAGALAGFGASWLGWDSAAGARVIQPAAAGFDLEKVTRTPRKYGFHATLKAPFRLGQGAVESDLIRAADAFAGAHAPVVPEGIEARHEHGFLALRALGDTGPLSALAGNVVRGFDGFRAPMRDADIARRRKARLSPRQDAQMLEWGYPFIFEDFHFHMTLSGRIDVAGAGVVLPVLRGMLEPVLPRPFVLDSITVMGEDAQGMFHQIHRAPLAG